MAKRKAPEKKKDPRNRRMVSAFFDMDKPDEAEVVEFNDRVRMNKSLNEDGTAWKNIMKRAILIYHGVVNQDIDAVSAIVPALGDAMRLYSSLKRGDVSVLQKLFPESYALFKAQLEADIIENTRDETRAHVIENIYEVQRKLSGLDELRRSIERLQLSGNNTPKTVGLKPVMAETDGSIQAIKPMSVAQFEVPDYEDDNDLFVVNKDEDAGQRVANNVISSLKAIQSHKGEKDPVIEARMKARQKKGNS